MRRWRHPADSRSLEPTRQLPSGVVAPSAEPTSGARAAPEKLAVELVDRALARRLVVAPALDLRPVADPPGGDVVERDLHHQLGPQQDPFELVRRPPARGLACPALAGLVRPQLLHQLALLGRLEPRRVADLARVASLVVETKDQRADRALLLARPPADHDAVDGPDPLDLDHADALARPVRAGQL